ncbi:unannotated protein [freshwater metagenome]|uniref:Unannotated protein n=1 Tax=freshwater metagenome TaxID=449393 RepID=A0A6J7H9Q9_9ZZZZ
MGDVRDHDAPADRGPLDARQHLGHLLLGDAHVLGQDRSQALERRVGQPPRGEQRLGLGLVGGPLGPGGAGGAEARHHLLGEALAELARLVEPAQQDDLGLGGQAHVLPLVDGPQAVPVDQLERRRHQAGLAHRPHGRAGGHDGGEEAGDGHGRRGQRAQPDGDLGDDPERALRPDDQAHQVVARHALGGAPTEPDDLAAAGHDLELEHVVAGDAVLHAAQAPGVGRHVAADRRPGRARGVRGVPEAVLGHRGAQVVVDDPGLDDGQPLQGVDLEHPVHPLERHDDAALERVRPAGQPGAGTAGDDRDAVAQARAHHVDDVGGAGGADHRGGPTVRGPRGLVAAHGRHDVGVGQHGTGRQPGRELVGERGARDVGGGRRRRQRSCHRHGCTRSHRAARRRGDRPRRHGSPVEVSTPLTVGPGPAGAR